MSMKNNKMKGTIKMKLTEKQLEKIKSAKSAEEMIAFAKEEGLVLDEEKVNAMFAALPQNGELSDEQLDQVSGGSYNDFTEEYNGRGHVLVGRYVQVKSNKKCGKIISFDNHESNVWDKIVHFFGGVEYTYTIQYNDGSGNVVLSQREFELLPGPIIDVQYSDDGHGVSITF